MIKERRLLLPLSRVRKEIGKASGWVRGPRKSTRRVRRERCRPSSSSSTMPAKSKYEPQLVDPLGAGGEGVGKQQLQGQQ